MIKPLRRRAQKSLRTTLVLWFIFLSIVPLAFVTGYSVVNYEKAIDRELSQRVEGNARELEALIQDVRSTMLNRRDQIVRQPAFVFLLSTADADGLFDNIQNIFQSDLSTGINLFDRNGKLILSLKKDSASQIKKLETKSDVAVYLTPENLNRIKALNEVMTEEFATDKSMSLILFSRVINSSGKVVGFLEQSANLNTAFLETLKKRMHLELILLKKNGQVVTSTQQDFFDYPKDYFNFRINDNPSQFFELNVRGKPFGFLLHGIKWGDSDFYVGLGVSKSDARLALRNVNYAFYSVIAAVIIVLIITSFLITKNLLKPLDDLVQATQFIQLGEKVSEIPIKSESEIGLLTESFNDMSRSIMKVRAELKSKITELEKSNHELNETQTRLVQSSKMSSLGQLVAGVAHELNNPISFIYSNMTHLRDYAEKLINLADAVETRPSDIASLKKEYDIDFIKKDLPKLISSCEEGARRTRDIVLGLRNFSRLEESQLREIDINTAIDDTLSLLAGEIKNKIEIHKKYSELPKVSCFATQVNQVFMNILSNAIQAIDGKGKIWITTKKIKLKNNRDAVSISIQDSGKGMKPEIQEKIFDPFFSTKSIGQGTGLGLSISYGIIQNHNGEILVKSQIDIGTEFIVQIPIRQKA
jgi:two-component system, NtrC family, sensor kinase